MSKSKSLEELSPLAALLARSGLFAEAAAVLRRAELSGAVDAELRDWIEAYNLIDAPHHAVRRASRGLDWPPPAEELWRARAAYPIPFTELTAEVEAARGLPDQLIPAIARKESLFDPRAVSRVGAMGMMQMMPQTYEVNRKRAGLPPLAEGELPGPRQSILAAGHELAALLERFGGSLPLAIMAYNGGAGAVSRWLERSGGLPIDVFVEKGGFAQTRNYVRRVFRNLVRYRQLYGLPLPELPPIAVAPGAPDEPDGGPGSPAAETSANGAKSPDDDDAPDTSA
jgi:soluble lytic murein transglycosylase